MSHQHGTFDGKDPSCSSTRVCPIKLIEGNCEFRENSNIVFYWPTLLIEVSNLHGYRLETVTYSIQYAITKISQKGSYMRAH